MRHFLYGLTASLITTASAIAHPGHGVTEGDSMVHHLVEPLHVGPVVLVLVAGLLTTLAMKRRSRSLRHEHARKR